MFGKKAKQESEHLNIENAALREQVNNLAATLEEIGGNDILEVKAAHKKAVQEFEEFIAYRNAQIGQLDSSIFPEEFRACKAPRRKESCPCQGIGY